MVINYTLTSCGLDAPSVACHQCHGQGRSYRLVKQCGDKLILALLGDTVANRVVEHFNHLKETIMVTKVPLKRQDVLGRQIQADNVLTLLLVSCA